MSSSSSSSTSAVAVSPARQAELALCCAVEQESFDDVRSRVEAGVSVHAKNERCQTPLYISAGNAAALPITEYLIDHGADVNVVVDDLRLTPLHAACKENNEGAAKLLLQYGADPFILDRNGRSILHFAAMGASPAMMRKLIKRTHGKLTNHADDSGYTPLMVACEHGRVEVVQLLLEASADPSLRNRLNHQAIELADWFGHRKVMEELEAWLKRLGASTTAVSTEALVPPSPAANMSTPLPLLMSPTAAATPSSAAGDTSFSEGPHAAALTGGGAADPIGAQLQKSDSAVPFTNKPAILG